MERLELNLNKCIGTALLGSAFIIAGCNSGSSDVAAADAPSRDTAVSDSKVAGPLDPLQAIVADVVGAGVGGALPDPLGPSVMCASDSINALVDVPDLLLLSLQSLPDGEDPAAALQDISGELVGSLQDFATQLQGTLMSLAGGGNCGTAASSGAFALGGANPLAGTPLEPVGAALQDLSAGLSLLDTGITDGDDPNLTSVTDTVTPLLAQLSAAFAMVPPEVSDAPVIGGVVQTLESAVGDLAFTLPFVGNYQPFATQFGLELLIDNLLSNVLLETLPVDEIDAATGQNFRGQIEGAITQVRGALGLTVGTLITPAFNDLLNGAAAPILDPVEGLLAQLLGGGQPIGDGGLPVGGNPLQGLLGSVAGDGTGTPLDLVLGLLTTGAGNDPLNDLVATVSGGSADSPLAAVISLLGGLPALDQVLGQASSASQGGLPLNGLLDSLLGGLLGG